MPISILVGGPLQSQASGDDSKICSQGRVEENFFIMGLLGLDLIYQSTTLVTILNK